MNHHSQMMKPETSNQEPIVLPMSDLTNADLDILEAVGKYKFLVPDQMERLGIASLGHIYRRCPLLVESDRLRKSYYGGTFGKEANKVIRYPDIHCLSPQAVKLLVEDNKLAQFPKNHNRRYTIDYVHRILTIDVQISYNLWIEKHKLRPVMYQNYLNGTGSQIDGGYVPSTTVYLREDKEKPQLVKCDFIFVFERNGIKYPFIGELIREKRDRAVKQLETLAKTLEAKLHENKYGWETMPYVLAVFDNEELMAKVFDYMSTSEFFDPFPYDKIKQAFLFATCEHTRDFDCDRLKLDGTTRKLLRSLT